MRFARLAAGVAFGAVALAGFVAAPTPTTVAFAASNECAPGNIAFSPDAPLAFPLLQTDAAWARSTGAGIVVAVVDSGIDGSNPHLKNAVVGGIDLVGDGERADGLSDPQGHGTAIAGQIAARAVDGSGVIGLAPDAKVMPVRVFRGTDDESVRNGFGPTTERLATGIRYAAENGATIINVSLSDYADSGALRDAVDFAHSRGSLVVASAGNRATSEDTTDGPRYPAAYDAALAVTATDNGGVVTDDSIHGPHVDVSAPGADVATSATGAGDCIYASDAPSSSFATAYTSAAAALVAAAHPGEGPDEWAYRLEATAARTDPDRRDDVNGWGLIQPASAITLLPDATTRGPEGPFFDTSASAVRPGGAVVTPNSDPSPFVLTAEATALLTVAGAAALGTIGTVIILRRRRQTERETVAAAVAAPTGLGLLERESVDEYE